MKKGMFRRAAIAALTCGTVVAASSGTLAQAGEMDVNIGYYPGAMFQSLLFVADVKGFYKQAGLNPTFIAVQNGPLMNSQMGSGAIDFGFQPPSNVGLARQQGMNQVFITGNITMPWVLVTRKEVKVPNQGKYPDVIRDLKGLNWGVYGRGSDGELFMRVMAGDAGLDLDKDMTWIGIGGPPTGLPALRTGRIDAYLTLDPAPIVAESGGYGKTILDLRKGEGPGDFKGIIYQGVVTLRKTAESRPKAVEAIVKAHTAAYCWVRDEKNFPELLTILKGKLPVAELSPAQFEGMVRANLPTFTLTVPADHFKVWNTMLLRANILKSAVPPEETVWKSVPATDPKC